MSPFLRLTACFLLASLSSSALFAQEPLPDFSSIDRNLEALETLIGDTLSNSETLTRQLQNLRENLTEQERILSERETSIAAQERLLTELRQQLNEMSQTYKAQSALSAKYERSSRFWRNFTLIGIPVAALLGGLTVGLVMGTR
jgi:septal ring factor EnvC (AmiA/AmiB activator)